MLGRKPRTVGKHSASTRSIALVLGLLLPLVGIGSGAVMEACLDAGMQAIAMEMEMAGPIGRGHVSHSHGSNSHSGHHHDNFGCTWLGLCNPAIMGAPPATGAPTFRIVVAPESPQFATAGVPRPSPLAFLLPHANAPPAELI